MPPLTLPVISWRTVLSLYEPNSGTVVSMMKAMTGAALVRKVRNSCPAQGRTLTHMFAWSLLSYGLRSVVPDARPQPPAAGRRIYDCPHFKEVESGWKEKCWKAGAKYEGPQQDEDYSLGSVDLEEKKRAEKATEKRRGRLSKRFNRSRNVDTSQQVLICSLSKTETCL